MHYLDLPLILLRNRVVRKRMLLWDYTNTQNVPQMMDKVNFQGPISSVCNWNAWVPPELKGRLPFRPMIHLISQTQGEEWQWILNTNQPLVIYFNEPERNGITPEQAASIWRNKVLQLRKKGKKLCSPCCAGDAPGAAWINKFLSLVHDVRPDFLGLHVYNTDADAAIKYIKDMHDKHKLPVIVHEIASISRDYKQVVQFTTRLANWMDQTAWIHEYAFFGCMQHVADDFVSPAAQLMNPNGTFTDLMLKLMNDQPMRA